MILGEMQAATTLTVSSFNARKTGWYDAPQTSISIIIKNFSLLRQLNK